MKLNNILNAIIISLCFVSNIIANEFETKGQISAWAQGNFSEKSHEFYGIRFLPSFTLLQFISDDVFFDTELSFNTYFQRLSSEYEKDFDLYRLKFRIATPQTETRIGLQKISFGPARLLRSLIWFDSIDLRDPLGLTDGVFGFQFRYIFLNNLSIRLWTLYGNHSRKGLDIFKTDKDKPEFGGRLQFPFLSGELGLTYNLRKSDAKLFTYNERKFGFDGRFDIELGLWFECVIIHNDTKRFPRQYIQLLTLGTDYTFDIGNGLLITAENLTMTNSEIIEKPENAKNVSAISLNYPVGLLDNLSAFSFYSWEAGEIYNNIQWNRSYDDFSINLTLFNYPKNGKPIFTQAISSKMTSGFGAQIMVIYNY